MYILGISAYYHDSAACLVKDGEILAAAQEERFTRKKHDFNFPSNAVQYCLSSANIQGKDLDYVAFYDKPFIKFERLLETYLSLMPPSESSPSGKLFRSGSSKSYGYRTSLRRNLIIRERSSIRSTMNHMRPVLSSPLLSSAPLF